MYKDRGLCHNKKITDSSSSGDVFTNEFLRSRLIAVNDGFIDNVSSSRTVYDYPETLKCCNSSLKKQHVKVLFFSGCITFTFLVESF